MAKRRDRLGTASEYEAKAGAISEEKPPEASLKLEEASEGEDVLPPPVFGLAMVPTAKGKYLVVRGQLDPATHESLSPTRHGEHVGESMHSATARLMTAVRKSLGVR